MIYIYLDFELKIIVFFSVMKHLLINIPLLLKSTNDDGFLWDIEKCYSKFKLYNYA